jgi:hypothetical protein
VGVCFFRGEGIGWAMEPERRMQARAWTLELTAARGPGKSICPSEVARRFGRDWREQMPLVREEAGKLAQEGRIWILQRGQPVSVPDAKGPIRLAWPEGVEP